MNQAMTLSRRAICVGGIASATLAAMPKFSEARDYSMTSAPIAKGSVLDLRGVRIGEHAVLRTFGQVSVDAHSGADQRIWRFVEDTLVSWRQDGNGNVVERRMGRTQLTPSQGGKAVEISTGPVEEHLKAIDQFAVVATTADGQSLLVTAAPLTPSDAWTVLDDPASAILPSVMSEYRVFRIAGNQRAVYWALRSPWLTALGEAPTESRLLWRGQGRLLTWQKLESGAAV